jgi:hypothetical protein
MFAFTELLLGDTVYSTGYSERAYIRIPVGLDIREVQKRLGEPIGISTNKGRHRYHYTTWGISDPAGGRDCCFSIRSLIVSNGVVVGKKRGQFHIIIIPLTWVWILDGIGAWQGSLDWNMRGRYIT